MNAAGRRTTVHRRTLAVGALAVALATGLAACSGPAGTRSPEKGAPAAKKPPAAAPQSAVRLIGDGSTAFTGL